MFDPWRKLLEFVFVKVQWKKSPRSISRIPSLSPSFERGIKKKIERKIKKKIKNKRHVCNANVHNWEVRVTGPCWAVDALLASTPSPDRDLDTSTTLPVPPFPCLFPEIVANPPIPFDAPLVAAFASGLVACPTSGKAKFASSDSSLMSIFLLFESSSPAPFQPC